MHSITSGIRSSLDWLIVCTFLIKHSIIQSMASFQAKIMHGLVKSTNQAIPIHKCALAVMHWGIAIIFIIPLEYNILMQYTVFGSIDTVSYLYSGIHFWTDKDFLPEPNNFFEVFSSEWFKVIYYLVIFEKFGVHFSVLNPGKNGKFKWTRLTTILWSNDS